MKKPEKTEAPKRETELDQLTAQLHTVLKQETTDVILIGNLLIRSRALLKLEHGDWQLWLAENFDLSYRTAHRYCKAAEYVELTAKVTPVAFFANLSPTVLYALSEGRYSEEAEKALLAGARKGRVDQTRAEEIREKADYNADDDDHDHDDDAADDGSDADDAEKILDGPPPDVPPPAPIAPPPDFALPAFDLAMKTLKKLLTKPVAKFASTVHAGELEEVASFIRAVAQASKEKSP